MRKIVFPRRALKFQLPGWDFHFGAGLPRRAKQSPSAFTLVELLVVIAIIIVLMSVVVPAFNGIRGGNDLTKATYSIAGTLDQARAYAMANNTYVFVGIAEVDAAVLASNKTQTPATATVGGRVAVAVVASKDGFRGYDVTNTSLATPPWPTNTGSTLVAIGKLLVLENVHLQSSGVWNGNSSALGYNDSDPNNRTVGTGRMLRPYVSSSSYILTGRSASSGGSVTQFAWPLGNALGSGQYNFPTVINFDPQGVPRIQTNVNTDMITRYLEIGLMPTHGNVVPATAPSNIAAIQINGMTGATRIFRP